MSEAPKNFLGTMPVATVIQLLVAVFALGGIWNRFQALEKDHAKDKIEIDSRIEKIQESISEIESNKASKIEVKSTHDRLSKYIERFNSNVEKTSISRRQLMDEIHKLKYAK
jgi:hypothetical protein